MAASDRDTMPLNVRIPTPLYDYLKAQATVHHHSMRAELIDVLEDDKARHDGSEEAFAEKYGAYIRREIDRMLAERV